MLAARCGVVDIGSNTATLALYLGGTDGFLDRVRQDAEPLRLLRRIGPDGAFPPATLEKTVSVMRTFAAIAREEGVNRVEAVATSAVRDAANGGLLAQRIREEAGFPLTILAGDAEARAAAVAVVNTLPVSDGLLFDLGGGSLQLTELVDRRPARAVSLPLGGLRLADAFLRRDPPAAAELTALRRHIEGHLRAVPWLTGAGAVVGVGGTVRALSKLDRAENRWPIRHDHGYLLSEDGVLACLEKLSRMNARDRAAVPGLAEHRVDTIVSGAMVVATLMRLARRESVRVSGYGLREGIAWRILHGTNTPDVRRAGLSGRLPDTTGEGDAAVAEALRRLPRGLPSRQKAALLLAVRMRTLGVSPSAILASPIQGFDQEELVEAAALLGAVPGVTPDPRLVQVLAALPPEELAGGM